MLGPTLRKRMGLTEGTVAARRPFQSLEDKAFAVGKVTRFHGGV